MNDIKKIVVISDKYISFQTKALSFVAGLEYFKVSTDYFVSQETDFTPELFTGADAIVYSGAWIHAKDMARIQKLTSVPLFPWIVSDAWVDHGYAELLNTFPHIFASTQFALTILARDGVDIRKLSVLHESVDTTFFQPNQTSESQITELKRRFGLNDDRPVLLTIGGDIASKGALSVIRALHARNLLEKVHYILHLNPKYNLILEEGLAELQQENTPTDQLIVETEFFDTKTVRALYDLCDLYVAPCRFETFGRPLVEAMACGKPVLGIAAGSLKETIVDGETGVLVPVGETITGHNQSRPDFEGTILNYHSEQPIPLHFYPDLSALGEAAENLITDAKKRQQLGHAARHHVEKKFASEVIAEQFLLWLTHFQNH